MSDTFGHDAFVKSRFQAGRGAAASGIDPEVLELAEGGGGGAQTAQAPGVPSPVAAPPPSAGPGQAQPYLPFGLKVPQAISNWMQNSAKKQAADREAVRTRELPGFGAGFTGAVSNSWESLKQAYDSWSAEAQQKRPDLTTADGLKQQFAHDLSAGKVAGHAVMLLTSPFAGIWNEAAGAVAKGLGAGADGKGLRPNPSQWKDMFDQASLALGPEAEGLAVAKTGAAADEVANLARTAAPKAAPGAPPPGAAPGATATETAATAKPGVAAAAPDAEAAPRPFDLAAHVDRPGHALKVTPEIRAQAESFLAGRRADNPIQVSLEGLSSNADLNQTVSDVARFIPKGKVKPDDIRDMNAYSLNLPPDEVMARLVPQYPTDEMQAAAAMLVNSAGGEFQKFARAAMENPSPEAHEAAVRAYAQANDIIGKFRDSGTDLGRGLRTRQATLSGRADFSKALEQIIADVGPDNVDEAIRKAAALPDPKTVAPFVSSLRWMGGREGLLFGWYNWLLSNPRTIVSNVLSNVGASGWNVAVRYAAEKFGSSGDIRPGEAAALVNGYIGSMRDGIAAAGKALKAGKSQFYGDYQTMDGQRVIRSTDHYSPEPIQEDNPTSGAVSWLRSALPTSWIGAADDFAKVTNYRAEARALAYREGVSKGLTGDALGEHVTQTLNNIPEHLHHQAMTSALRNTFQEPLTGIAEKMQDIVDLVNIPTGITGVEIPLGRLIMPFVKTPANLARFAYHNSAMAALIPSAKIKAELAAGGATRDMAIARMGLGTAVSMTVLPFMMGGSITGRGPADPQLNRAWRDAGNRPYSVKVGDTWYGYNRVDPLGLHIGVLADTVETLKFARDEDAEQLAWSAAFGVGDAMLSKTYLQGMSNFLEALHDPQGEGKYFGDKLVGSLTMPAGANAVAAATDPWLREHYDLLDTISARTPGLSSQQPPVRDIWGDAIPLDKRFLPLAPQTLAQMVSPIEMRPSDNVRPIDKWIWDNRAAFPDADEGRLGLTRPGQVQNFDSGQVSAQIKLSGQQLDKLRVLAGNGLKDPATGLGAKDALNALVEGKYPQAATQRQWSESAPAAQAVMLLRIWNRYRTAAKRMLLADDPDLQAAVSAQLATRTEQLKAPAGAAP